ncbi:cupin, partial [Methylophaga sp. 42_8_T64]
IESRLIEEKGPSGPWQVTTGPLTEEDFARLPPSHWTMLVQDVDKHLPELQELVDPFRFIPDWRRDDLMVSYAPEQGSVGPHTDGYDVFLLQAMGTRRWQISNDAVVEQPLIAGLDLQILQQFDADQTWDLEPGDMLYLPPHFAHHGVALNDCMTFSFGFRAPSKTDLLDAVINTLLERELAQQRFSDANLIVAKQQHQISQQAVSDVKQLLHDVINDAEPLIASALGRLVTDTKSSLVDLAELQLTETLTVTELAAMFEQGQVLQKNLYYRFAWHQQENSGGQLFFAGEQFEVDNIDHLKMLAEYTELSQTDWQKISQDEASVTILSHLIAEGGWYWQSAE